MSKKRVNVDKMIKPSTLEAYKLLHDGTLVMAEMERNGINVDVAYIKWMQRKTQKHIDRLTQKLKEDKIYKKWEKHFGAKTKLGSREQLAYILFNVMKIPNEDKTTIAERYKADANALEDINLPFTKMYLKCEKLKKAKNTYLANILRESVDGVIHPNFNLNTVRTFRGSSDHPNFTNVPMRDPLIKKLIRHSFIAREGHCLVDLDFKGSEVNAASWYHKDPKILKYIETDPGKMHTDAAKQVYMLPSKLMTPEIRYCAKNMFVFPQFYGDWWLSCAHSLWKAIDRLNLRTSNGIPLKEWLRRKGIVSLGTGDPKRIEPNSFEAHLKEVEYDFWYHRFRVYQQWKEEWWEQYQSQGFLQMLTGFVISGYLNRKECINYPVQGCLAGESKVLTSKGLIPIKDLVGKRVKVWTGFRWANAVGLDRGECKRVDIKLSSGLTVRCDTRHKLKNEKDEWIDFSNLKIGNYIALPKVGNVTKKSKEVNWWFLLGFIIGDGCISNIKRKSVSIVVGEKKKDDLYKIKDFLVRQGFIENKYGGVHLYKRYGKYYLWIQSRRLSSILEKYGLIFGTKAYTKRIPKSVWKSSNQNRRDFLEGLWKSDGARAKWANRSLHMCNKQLLLEIQILASSIGFDSKLSITTNGGMLRFDWKKHNSKSTRKHPATVVRRQVQSIELKNYHDDRIAYVTDRRNFNSGKDISQHVAERIIGRNSKNPVMYRYDKIEKITVLDRKEHTFTMAVDNNLHQFVADGVIHKNTAFHCLLWCLIRINELLKKYRMKTKLVGQIHDDAVSHTPEKELQNYIELALHVITIELRKHWPWIIVPMKVEVEVTPVGGSWYDKREYKI